MIGPLPKALRGSPETFLGPALTRRAAMLAGLWLIAAGRPVVAAEAAVPAKPENGAFQLGIQPWLGYGLWHVAARRGLFAREGLSDVRLVNFSEDKDVNAALASGEVDGASIATHTAMGMVAAGLPVRIVMVLDVSTTADAVLSSPDIGSIQGLKGKAIAFEQGTTSDILINHALESNGMSIADIEAVPMPAAEAGAALAAGRVAAAVTYEPYVSVARAQRRDIRVLFTAGADQGLISDVLVVRDDVIRTRPGQVAAMLRAWQAALVAYEGDTAAGRAVIADAVGSDTAELQSAFEGIRFYSLDENRAALAGDFARKVLPDVAAAAKRAGIIAADVSAAALIDPRFVAAP